MKIHEYQAKEIFASVGIPVPRGEVAATPQEAQRIAETLGSPVMVKAQVHAGGRGKAGGIRRAETPKQVNEAAKDILAKPLVTHQTGPGGKRVNRVLVEKTVNIANELYIGLAIDRKRRSSAIMVSSRGGVEIEEIARQDPEAIFTEWIDPTIGLPVFQAYRLANYLGLDQAQTRKVSSLIQALYRLFAGKDCSLVEINPLVIERSGEVVALDAKVDFDDNALFRHPEIAALQDESEVSPLELKAKAFNLNYIKLDGNVGCLVNGAGLAMATMDLIELVGASPANFLDVGGGADETMIENAFCILLSDPAVEAVFINIFGGILRCDALAQGIVRAAETVTIDLPVVIRLEGTNVKEGRKVLRRSSFHFSSATDMQQAAALVAAAVEGRRA